MRSAPLPEPGTPAVNQQESMQLVPGETNPLAADHSAQTLQHLTRRKSCLNNFAVICKKG